MSFWSRLFGARRAEATQPTITEQPAVPALAAVLGSGQPDADEIMLAARTTRALQRLRTQSVCVHTANDVANALASGVRWFVRAGVFDLAPPPTLIASATGRGVVACGMPLAAPPPTLEQAPEISIARDWIAKTGGDLSGVEYTLPDAYTFSERALSGERESSGGRRALAPDAYTSQRRRPVAALLVDEAFSSAWRAELAADVHTQTTAWTAVQSALSKKDARVVHLPSLDAPYATEARVIELVTSLQVGGAEKVARDLAQAMVGGSARVAALGRATRARWPVLPHEIDLGAPGLSPAARMARLIAEMDAWGTDVVHTHLFGPDVIEALAASGYPPVVTIHNARRGWPPGTKELDSKHVTLVIGCAQAVENELREDGVRARVRTIVNGVHNGVSSEQESLFQSRASTLRASFVEGADALLLLVIANPRPQKRLDRVPSILARLRERTGKEVHLVWAGAASDTSDEARRIEEDFRRDLAERGVHLHALGAQFDLDDVRRACDVLLTTSDWEGLSLSHLEALAAGLPIVVTDVGGTREIAREAPECVRLVDANAAPDVFAEAIESVTGARRAAGRLPPLFEVRSMVSAHGRLLRRAARASCVHNEAADGKRRSGVVLITNNFSPGGAQSSARRLLATLASRGHKVSAITLQEHKDNPTPGTSALRAAGISVCTLENGMPAHVAAERAARWVDERRAAAVLFWNVIAEHKALILDLLWDVPVFDVSPGEMYFRSLARYFEAPRADLSIRNALDYGRRLAGAVVKFEAEGALARRTLGCDVSVIPNGVPIIEGAPRERAPGEPFRFGTAVRIHPDKRLELLLEALEKRVARGGPDCELWVLGAADAGAQPYSDELRGRSVHLPVRWLGFSDDVPTFLRKLDAFVLVAEPSGCPNASLEALGAGLPVVATDVGGIGEQLSNGAGLVVPRQDPEAFSEALWRISTQPNLRAALTEGGRSRAKSHFGLDLMADRYARLVGLGTGQSGGS
ncbi:MAG: glycosyltransferase [Polyangiaceae bacterium]|nr:glycosyltransferase [Polyangiaceae bacterium]